MEMTSIRSTVFTILCRPVDFRILRGATAVLFHAEIYALSNRLDHRELFAATELALVFSRLLLIRHLLLVEARCLVQSFYPLVSVLPVICFHLLIGFLLHFAPAARQQKNFVNH